MTHHTAELSSIATQIEDLTRRIVAIADSYVGTDEEALASRLYEIERSLVTTSRRLDAVVRII